jgi:hypothetical protein
MRTAHRPTVHGTDDKTAADRAQAAREREAPPIGKPEGFENDPPDAANPNEVIERHRRKLRPNGK